MRQSRSSTLRHQANCHCADRHICWLCADVNGHAANTGGIGHIHINVSATNDSHHVTISRWQEVRRFAQSHLILASVNQIFKYSYAFTVSRFDNVFVTRFLRDQRDVIVAKRCEIVGSINVNADRAVLHAIGHGYAVAVPGYDRDRIRRIGHKCRCVRKRDHISLALLQIPDLRHACTAGGLSNVLPAGCGLVYQSDRVLTNHAFKSLIGLHVDVDRTFTAAPYA